MRRTILKRGRGFTLIEIMVVIAIIGIIAGIILVLVSDSGKKAKAAATKQSLSGLRSAMALCCANNENSLHASIFNPDNGIDICLSENTGARFLTASELRAENVYYEINASCSNPWIKVHVDGHPKDECNETPDASSGNSNNFIIETAGLLSPSGC
ncbi:MAG: hypothetical protein ACD_8C00144G0004 [uncultured bacterium]|nr:MAG: hypothetical protein ACD_8C00144G0004 [uncultured bacterium]